VTDKPGNQELIPRAQRFSVQVRLRYRCLGEDCWYDGWTVNMSRTGVLFRASKPLDPDTRIEMMLSLPPILGGESSANVFCKGQIVRVQEMPAAENQVALAATIHRFKFLRGQQPGSQSPAKSPV
jgi:hypothetical protein